MRTRTRSCLTSGCGTRRRFKVVRGRVARISAVILTVVAAADELHVFADDFRGPAVLAVLVGPFAGAQTAFDQDGAALAQIVLGEFGSAAEKNDAVPFGFFHGLAVAVLVAARGGNAQRGDGGAAVGGVADFRIGAEVAENNNLVDGSHIRTKTKGNGVK